MSVKERSNSGHSLCGVFQADISGCSPAQFVLPWCLVVGRQISAEETKSGCGAKVNVGLVPLHPPACVGLPA